MKELHIERFYHSSFLAIFLACGGLCAQAQSTAVAENGKQVKRITFDRENVSVTYLDGTKDENVKDFVVRRDITTGIRTVKDKQDSNGAAARWYTVDGRRLQAQPSGKGVYIKREGQRVRKVKK